MATIALNGGFVTLVDDDDAGRLSARKWQVRTVGGRHTAQRVERLRDGTGRRRTIQMHREIMACPAGMVVDHINGDSLDNRRANLRVCTQGQNTYNQSGRANRVARFKGVSFFRPRRNWRARIGVQGVQTTLGYFATEEAAARAYDAAAVRLHGPFARLNFPDEHPR